MLLTTSRHRKVLIALGACTALVFLVPQVGQAYHPNHALGQSPERVYQGVDQLDSVDLFTGGLSLRLPIGPYAMNYNSNVWRYRPVVENGQVETEAIPDRTRHGGLGWHFGWGAVYSPVHALNDTGRWMYIDEDGSRHVFHDQLHRGEDDGNVKVLYTRDGSYLRMVRHNAVFVDVEYPDGTTRRFNSWSSGLGANYWFEMSWGRHASASDPDVWASYNPAFTVWTLTERHGRVDKIHSSTAFNWLRVITKVEIGTVGGAAAVYNFEHTPTQVAVSCKDTAASTPASINVPILSAIVLPDGTRFEMPSHHTSCAGGIADVTGVLRELRLPTGGSLRWNWQEVEFPPGTTNSVFNSSAGVATREMVRKNGTIAGVWSYRTSNFGAGPSGNPGDDPKVITEVVYPTGDCTRHFFNARYWQSPAAGRGWEYGLPFDYSQSHGGRFLSAEVWTANTGAGACSGTKLRSTYLRFRHDATPGSGSAPASEWYQTNRQISATRTVFHDDEGRWVDTEFSEFDGLGHFRRMRSTGTLRSSSPTSELRMVFTNYTRATGIYGTAGYAPPGPSDPWVLGNFSYVRTEEPDGFGQVAKRIDMVFDDATGDLLCSRVRRSANALLARDLVTTHAYDGQGQLIDVKAYGGDLQTLSTSGGPCDGLPAQPEYWTRHAYEHGVRTSSRPMMPNGTPGPFLTLDVDIDPTTGKVLMTRDSSGFSVAYAYDGLGRNHRITPQEGAPTFIQFLSATAGSTPSVVTDRRDPVTGAKLSEKSVWFDDFGRPVRERQRMPGGGWNERQTIYNARGWVSSVSEWGDLNKVTRFLEFDPFGRAQRIRPPNGAVHDALVSYQGIRRTTERRKVAKLGGESYAARSQEFDSHGRLRRTEEASGSGGAIVPTTYDYDVASRRTRIRSGLSPVQERRFVYDNRGFLQSETHPEKGINGNGSVIYGSRDSRGLVRRITDGPSDLSIGYDFLGRKTQVWDRNQGSRVVITLDYDGGPGRGMSKLWKATRRQWVDVPWTATSADELATVTETFDYQGTAGAISRKKTSVVVGGESLNFSQTYLWTPLGDPSRISAAGGSIDYRYERGRLNEVVGWASFDYHPSGVWHHIDHANGVQERQEVDPHFTGRTGALWLSGAQIGTNGTGTMRYDGGGRVSGIGSWSMAYDSVGRLVDSNLLGWDQQFTWDSFGNLNRKTTTPPGGSPQTLTFPVSGANNRLTGSVFSYDGAGNLTVWASNVYSWNESGLLEHARAGQFDWIYLYTASGDRVATLMPSAARPVVRWTERGLAGRPLVEYLQVGSVSAPSPSFTVKRYVWAGSRLIGSDGTKGQRHYHLDHLGSVRVATDADGDETFGMGYLPFGEPAGDLDASEILQFTGHERDHPTGLDAMKSRFYTQVHGRFLSVDRINGNAAAPQSLNRYAYSLGDPLALVDPDGRSPRLSFQERIDACRADPQCGNGSSFNGEVIAGVADRTRGILGPSYVAGGLSVVALACGFGGPGGCGGAVVGFGKGVYERDLEGLSRRATLGGLRGFIVSKTFRRLYEREGRGSFSQGVIVNLEGQQGGESGAVPDGPAGTYNETITVTAEADGGSSSSNQPSSTLGVGEICNGSGCMFVVATGADDDAVREEVVRMQLEFQALDGLNELLSGACQINPFACAAGNFGGGSGHSPWTVIYAY